MPHPSRLSRRAIRGRSTTVRSEISSLRTLLRYLDAHGLRDPRGAAIEENESAIDAVAKQFADAIGDRERYGTAKTVAMSARDRGVDIGDPAALTAFLDDVREGRVVLDEDLLGRVLAQRGQQRVL